MLYRFTIALFLVLNLAISGLSQTWHNAYYTAIPSRMALCYDYTESMGGLICMSTLDNSGDPMNSDYYLVRINQHGDTLWKVLDMLDDGRRCAPLAMTQLTGGDYVIVTLASEFPFDHDYLAFDRIDSNGYIINRIIKPANGGTIESEVNVIRADNNGYYVCYLSATTVGVDYLDKYGSGDTLLWSRQFSYGSPVIGRTADDGVMFITSGDMGKYDANGTLVYDYLTTPAASARAWYIIGTSDTGAIAYVYYTSPQTVVKLNAAGVITHSISHNSDLGFGTETSRGDYIMVSPSKGGFYRYDSAFNLIDSVIRPFSETGYLTSCIMPNTHGGAFCAYFSGSGGTGHIYGVNFDSLYNIYDDLEISMHSNCLIPGDTSHLRVLYANNGTDSIDTTVVVVILDTNATFISSSITPLSISGDTILYAIDSLNPGAIDSMTINILIDSTTGIGTLLTFHALSPYHNNVHFSGDTAIYNRTTVGSFDPNFKEVNRPFYCSKDKPLIYTIGFENTGNYLSRNITILDTLDSHLDVSTFKLIDGTNHIPIISWPVSNVVQFTFPNINLPDRASDSDGARGELIYSIYAKNTAEIGDTIRNTAYITFDHNVAVVTDTVINVVSLHDGNIDTIRIDTGKHSVQYEPAIFPNPFSHTITITLPDSGMYWNIRLTDVLGNVFVNSVYCNNNINITPVVADGMYFIKATNLSNHKTFIWKTVKMSN